MPFVTPIPVTKALVKKTIVQLGSVNKLLKLGHDDIEMLLANLPLLEEVDSVWQHGQRKKQVQAVLRLACENSIHWFTMDSCDLKSMIAALVMCPMSFENLRSKLWTDFVVVRKADPHDDKTKDGLNQQHYSMLHMAEYAMQLDEHNWQVFAVVGEILVMFGEYALALCCYKMAALKSGKASVSKVEHLFLECLDRPDQVQVDKYGNDYVNMVKCGKDVQEFVNRNLPDRDGGNLKLKIIMKPGTRKLIKALHILRTESHEESMKQMDDALHRDIVSLVDGFKGEAGKLMAKDEFQGALNFYTHAMNSITYGAFLSGCAGEELMTQWFAQYLSMKTELFMLRASIFILSNNNMALLRFAVTDLGKVLMLQPGVDFTKHMVATIWNGKRSKAVQDYKTYLEKFPDNVKVQKILQKLETKNKKPKVNGLKGSKTKKSKKIV